MPTKTAIPISGTTRLAGVIGCPIQHTLSPAMHNAAFKALGLDAVYLPLGVPEQGLAPLLASLRSLSALGANVTVPYKEAVVPLLDECSIAAQRIGAVNTIVFAHGRLIGHNTDGPGFLASLKDRLTLKGKQVVLVGGGGAGRAVAVTLAEAGVRHLVVADVNQVKMEKLVEDLGRLGARSVRPVAPQSDALQMELEQADLVVNATPLGLKPGDPLPVPETWLPRGKCVMDLVYGKGPTRFLQAAARRRNQVVPGWLMLLHQGALAFRLWTRKNPPVAVMRRALIQAGGIKA